MSTDLGRHRRQSKRLKNWYLKRVRVGSYVIDCRYDPCIVTEIITYRTTHDMDINVNSLLTSKSNSCSAYHCAPTPVSEELAKEMAEFAFTHPYGEYLKKYVYKENWNAEEWDKMAKVWYWPLSTDIISRI